MKYAAEELSCEGMKGITELYGNSVFNIKTMRNYLSEKAYNSLTKTILQASTLDAAIADEVADAMKTWALEKGATHFTHWFQPLTGSTAEKHEAFLMPDSEGGAVASFSGKELIQGEPDASSFPSGGLRATFEARGYTAWDPTSPAFIKEGRFGNTLCIPTVFCSYHGEALDKKTPLLRSVHVLTNQLVRMAKLFGVKSDGRCFATLGAEQEYFLIDKEFYDNRLDLIQTGRTLFGRTPAKHQQLEDHYFGAIKPRILSFMGEVDRELWRLGIPSRTRHNEVSPAQFELAPVFEEQNLAVDHNMVVMDVLKTVADKHGFACLLHEKPFAGVNGSGKHNNWSVSGPDGKNWFSPGDNPHENAKFLTMVCALMKAVDTHAALLRSAVATANNDHRLGANEAPPAILSIFLGEQLLDVFEQLEKGSPKASKKGGTIKIGVSSLPQFPRDATDRNRTSPIAFTGNKFEFRAVGASQSCAGANVVLNTIMAEALDEICTTLEKAVADGKDFNGALQIVLQGIVRKHKRILFDGDNYSAEWRAEAARRGLPNLMKTPEALKAIVDPRSIALFTRYNILSERELRSRYEVYMHAYHLTVTVEAHCALTIAKTMVAPAVIDYQRDLADTIKAVKGCGGGAMPGAKAALVTLTKQGEAMYVAIAKLEKAVDKHEPLAMLDAMLVLRKAVDTLEGITPEDRWPLASYAQMMFMI